MQIVGFIVEIAVITFGVFACIALIVHLLAVLFAVFGISRDGIDGRG